jgi:hypothetical protein
MNIAIYYAYGTPVIVHVVSIDVSRGDGEVILKMSQIGATHIHVRDSGRVLQ